MSIEPEHVCSQCGKKYKHRQSLHRHKSSCHAAECSQNVSILSISAQECSIEKQSIFPCDKCGKEYKHIQSKNRHQNKCVAQNYEKQINELRKTINDLLNRECKMHHKTLEKINNINSNNINSNNTINIIALGKENINEILSKTEKINILNKKSNALPYMIEYMHFNDRFPQFKNIAITNNKNNLAHLYNPIERKFKLVNKKDLIEELIDYRVCDIEEYYLEYKDELDEPVRNKIEELLEHRGENNETIDKINLLLFNNRHKIDVK